MFIITPGAKCSLWFEPIITDNLADGIDVLLEWWHKPDQMVIEGTKLSFVWFDDDIDDAEFYVAKVDGLKYEA